MDRRTLNFQFLNTREQGTVWSQSFSEEIGCSFSVLRPLSPTPGGRNPITVMKVTTEDTVPNSYLNVFLPPSCAEFNFSNYVVTD